MRTTLRKGDLYRLAVTGEHDEFAKIKEFTCVKSEYPNVYCMTAKSADDKVQQMVNIKDHDSMRSFIYHVNKLIVPGKRITGWLARRRNVIQ